VEIHVVSTPTDLARAAADNFVQHANDAIADHGRFTVALTGGRTPRDTYELIASEAYASRLDWSRVHVFWGDERCVPPMDEASNYGMARATLLAHVPIPAGNVHRMRGEDEPSAAAAAYETLVEDIVGDRFDLIHLGMGSDAHIASLFPGSGVLLETTRKVRAHFAEAVDMWRITLTPLVINSAANITFVVAGTAKADAVARVLHGPRDPLRNPAQIVAPDRGKVVWLLDAAAASLLP
jgi:6-phosphogluconolactonase